MNSLREVCLEKYDRFDLASFGLLAFITLFSLARYNYLPQFVDGYYHLSVANGFISSGGWVGWDWWSFAPLGRPHLYPPLYHIILSGLQKIGLAGITTLKVTEVAITPIFFFSLWFVFRKLVDSKFSLINLFVLSGFFCFWAGVSANISASLSLIFGFFAWYFLSRKRRISIIICLILAFYSHSGIPWIFFISLLLVACLNKEYRSIALTSLGAALIFALPLLIHLWKFRSYINLQATDETQFIQLSVLILGFGLPFLVANLFKKNLTNLFFLGYAFGAGLIFINYPYRFFSTQGVIGLALFSSLFLKKIFSYEKGFKRKDILALLIVFFLILHPTLNLDKGRLKLNFFNSTYYNLVSGNFDKLVKFKPIFYPQYYDSILETIKKHCGPYDIITSNLSVAGQIFASLSRRPLADSMLAEVRPKEKITPYENAKITIWIKPLTSGDREGKKSREWALIEENDIAYVFLNLRDSPQAEKIASSINFRVLFFIFLGLLSLLIFDNFMVKKFIKERKKRKINERV